MSDKSPPHKADLSHFVQKQSTDTYMITGPAEHYHHLH